MHAGNGVQTTRKSQTRRPAPSRMISAVACESTPPLNLQDVLLNTATYITTSQRSAVKDECSCEATAVIGLTCAISGRHARQYFRTVVHDSGAKAHRTGSCIAYLQHHELDLLQSMRSPQCAVSELSDVVGPLSSNPTLAERKNPQEKLRETCSMFLHLHLYHRTATCLHNFLQ